MQENLIQTLKIVTASVVLSFGISYVYAWTGPIADPPQANIDPPINVGIVEQSKAGNLDIAADLSAVNLVVTGGVGIGTINPGTNKLEVVGGPIKATGGLILETRATDPASPATGRVWVNTSI